MEASRRAPALWRPPAGGDLRPARSAHDPRRPGRSAPGSTKAPGRRRRRSTRCSPRRCCARSACRERISASAFPRTTSPAMLGAPEVVLSRSARDVQGPAIPSRFLLRVQGAARARPARALRGQGNRWRWPARSTMPGLAGAIRGPSRCRAPPSGRCGSASPRSTGCAPIPYQFYASAILRLSELDPLDAEPTPAWRGTAAHEVLETWHKTGPPDGTKWPTKCSTQMNHHPLMRALWRPRLMKALEWVEAEIARHPERMPTLIEEWGAMTVRGIEIFGKADRIDRLRGRHAGDRRLQDRPAAERRQVEQGYRAAARHHRPDGRTRRRSRTCRARRWRSNTGRSPSRRRARPASATSPRPS